MDVVFTALKVDSLSKLPILLKEFRQIFKNHQESGAAELVTWSAVPFGVRYLKIWQLLLGWNDDIDEVPYRFADSEIISFFANDQHLRQRFGREMKYRCMSRLRSIYRDINFCTSEECLSLKYPMLSMQYIRKRVQRNRRAIVRGISGYTLYMQSLSKKMDDTFVYELIIELSRIFLMASQIDSDKIHEFVEMLASIEEFISSDC